VALGLDEVAGVLASDTLVGRGDLPILLHQSDRSAHLRFWAGVLQAVAMPWLNGDREWFDRTELELNGREA
jgi:hypothetical protein